MKPSKLLRLIAITINLGMVVAVYFAVTNELLALGFLALVLSKWRILAAHPRFWLRNFINNLLDIMFGVSIVALMHYYYLNQVQQLLLPGASTINWTILTLALGLLVWQLVIKPRSSASWVATQTVLGLALSQAALWTYYPAQFDSGLVVVLLSSFSGFVAGYHFARQNPQYEGRTITYALLWTTIIAQFSWLGWLWNVAFIVGDDLVVPQMVLFSGATGYYLQSLTIINARSRVDRRKQFWQQSAYYIVLLLIIIGGSAFAN